jgi:hypothetical protein
MWSVKANEFFKALVTTNKTSFVSLLDKYEVETDSYVIELIDKTGQISSKMIKSNCGIDV